MSSREAGYKFNLSANQKGDSRLCVNYSQASGSKRKRRINYDYLISHLQYCLFVQVHCDYHMWCLLCCWKPASQVCYETLYENGLAGAALLFFLKAREIGQS